MIVISTDIKIEDLKDGVKIMSIESRYIFKEQNKEFGYDSSSFIGTTWNRLHLIV